MSQVRNGGVEFFNQASSVLSTLVPAAGIVNTGFAFDDYDQVWKAMDGPSASTCARRSRRSAC
jgi:TRAP-type C4-dicarboxylate transport system substrate-binding protein